MAVEAQVCQGVSPVLSEQIAVAPPMVSQAASTLTKLLSFIIFFILHRNRKCVTISRSLIEYTQTLAALTLK